MGFLMTSRSFEALRNRQFFFSEWPYFENQLTDKSVAQVIRCLPLAKMGWIFSCSFLIIQGAAKPISIKARG